MQFTAKEIAKILNGKIEGNPDAIITGVSKIDDSQPDTLAFLANEKYANHIHTTKASIVIVNESFPQKKEINTTLIRVANSYEAFARLTKMYENSKPKKRGVEKPAYITKGTKINKSVYVGAFSYIGKNVTIGENVQIYPNCYIGDNVIIGDNTTIYAGVKIYHECKIGDNCLIHAGAVIGADGFGFAPDDKGVFKKISHLGIVVIHNDVEIGANTTIDRATMGETIIKQGTKLDNLIQIGHNTVVGSNTVMAAQSGIAGSGDVGDNCAIGGQAAIAGHIKIANRTSIGAKAGVLKGPKEEGEAMLGSPAIKLLDFQKAFVIFKKLPDIKIQIENLQNDVDALKK